MSPSFKDLRHSRILFAIEYYWLLLNKYYGGSLPYGAFLPHIFFINLSVGLNGGGAQRRGKSVCFGCFGGDFRCRA